MTTCCYSAALVGLFWVTFLKWWLPNLWLLVIICYMCWGEPRGSGFVVGGRLGWPNCGFKLDDTFFISHLFFSGGPLLGHFSATKGSSGSGSLLYLFAGSDMSVLVVEKWLEMICAGQTEGGKMVACKFCIALVGASLCFSSDSGLLQWWLSTELHRGHSKLWSGGFGGCQRWITDEGLLPFLFPSSFCFFLLLFFSFSFLSTNKPPFSQIYHKVFIEVKAPFFPLSWFHIWCLEILLASSYPLLLILIL